MDPTTTAIGTWSGGRFMHFGEPLEEERLQALLRPGAGIDTVITADVYGEGEADSAARRGAARASSATSYCLVGAIGHDFYDGRARGREGLSRASPTRACAGEGDYGAYIRMATERSLERIGVERFDLLLLHNPDRIGYTSAAVWEGMQAVREAGLTRLLGVAPGPANGFTLDLIDCIERFGELIDWAMIILSPLEPWPGELVLDAAAAHDVSLITRVVDYGGLFHDDVLPGHEFAELRPPQVPPRGLGAGGREQARADAPLRRAPRPEHAAAGLPVEPRPPGGALRRAHADPGGSGLEGGEGGGGARTHAAPDRGQARGAGRAAGLRSTRGALSDAEVAELRAIGRQHRLHGAEGRQPRATRASRSRPLAAHGELAALAARWQIAPERDLAKAA